jgi:hypothetical protein
MGNLASLFCSTSEPPSLCMGKETLYLMSSSPTSVMFTPAEGRSGSDPHHGSSTSFDPNKHVSRTDGRPIPNRSSSDSIGRHYKPTDSLPRHLRFKQAYAIKNQHEKREQVGHGSSKKKARNDRMIQAY